MRIDEDYRELSCESADPGADTANGSILMELNGPMACNIALRTNWKTVWKALKLFLRDHRVGHRMFPTVNIFTLEIS
uniref:ELFV_dehydrog_N domain-containing protein n=1 Tax=Angiostrongylus cantonensis TaxID=6313 RepID=A0A0K0D9Y4_ANGCA